MPFRPKPINIGIDGLIVYKIFSDITTRDAYFTAHPEELVNDMFIYVASISKIQKYTKPADVWVDVVTPDGYWLFIK